MEPGEIIYGPGQITINPGMEKTKIQIENTSDVPAYIGSHYHLYEINQHLVILNSKDRQDMRGLHLNLPAGDVLYIPPGAVREAYAVPYSSRGYSP